MTGNDLLSFASQANQPKRNHPSNGSEKSPKALRTISEVAEIIDVPQHVLRFWETKFAEISPLKRNGGRRFYRPADIEVIQQIKFLLYQQGYTIKGAQKAIEDYAKVVNSTMADIGKPRIEHTAKPANSNDNHVPKEGGARNPAINAHSLSQHKVQHRTMDIALEKAALASLRADIIAARNDLATKLGKEHI